MEVITALTLKDIHKILLDEARHWRMHFKATLKQWLVMVATRKIENETGEGTFSKTDCDNKEPELDYCGICDFISIAMQNGADKKVLFYWDYDGDKKEYTLTNIDIPEKLKVDTKKENILPETKHGEVIIKSDRKLYIDFQTCARYMAFVPETDDDNRQLEDWILNACFPIIKKDCNDAKLLEADFQPFTDVDKFICKAEATGILLETNRFPKGSQIVIEYECDNKGIVIHAPKLATEDGKELADLDLYSEPITWLPKDRWIEVPREKKLIPSNEIIEGFWLVKSDKVMAYHEWLMCAAGTAIQLNLGGADVRTNWNENEAPITWHDALEKLMADCDSSDEFKVTYSLRHLLDDRGAYSYRELNIYSCEPVKK